MSIVRPFLNIWLRKTEKAYLERVEDPNEIRKSFESKARWYFHAPLGSRFEDQEIGGRRVQWACAKDVSREDGPVLLYFHGGAYVMGSPRTHRAMLAKLSALTRLPACLPTYRLAPEHPFPAPIEDALSVYRALSKETSEIVIGGDSAGGGLALALLSEIGRQGLLRPMGVFAFSPLTDMSFSGASVVSQAEADAILPVTRTKDIAKMYLNGADPEDPRASPLFAAFPGAPPVWLCAGDTEILYDDTRRMTKHLRAEGVEVTEHLTHDLPHVWPIFHNILPEARRTLRHLASWIKSLSRRSDDS